MKKVFIYIVIVLSVCCFIPCVHAAETGKFITCDSSTISPGGTVTCSVIGTKSDGAKVGSVEFNLSADTMLTVTNTVTGAAGFTCDYGDKWGCISSSGVDNGGTIGTFTVTASESATAGSTANVNITVYQVAAVDSSIAADENEQTDYFTLTIGNGTTDSENPKTMDTNLTIIVTIILVGTATVIYGAKKLNRIGR